MLAFMLNYRWQQARCLSHNFCGVLPTDFLVAPNAGNSNGCRCSIGDMIVSRKKSKTQTSK